MYAQQDMKADNNIHHSHHSVHAHHKQEDGSLIKYVEFVYLQTSHHNEDDRRPDTLKETERQNQDKPKNIESAKVHLSVFYQSGDKKSAYCSIRPNDDLSSIKSVSDRSKMMSWTVNDKEPLECLIEDTGCFVATHAWIDNYLAVAEDNEPLKIYKVD